MKTFMATIVLLLSFNAFAGVRMIEEKATYLFEFINQELPQSIKDDLVKKNNKAKSEAVSDAIAKIDDSCIDPNWGNVNQVDVVSIDSETLESGGGIVIREVIVNAVCRGIR